MAKYVHKILIPKEHGAWAMLLIPYCIGVAVTGGFSTQTILGLIGVLLLFLCRPPLMILLKGRPLNGRYGLGGRELWLSFGIPAASGWGGVLLALDEIWSVATAAHRLDIVPSA